jgi:hypothetical protein
VTNFDVTPVGRAPGTTPVAPDVTRGDGGDDPFGSRQSVRRRGWVRIVLGAAGLVAGIVAAVIGILDAVDTRGKIESDAVARGVVRVSDGEFGPPVSFEAPPGGPHDYSVYLIFAKGNVVNREDEEDAAVRSTGCQATLPNERQVTFSGNVQGVATTIGRASSVGSFTSPPGGVEVRCAYGQGSRRTRFRRPDSVAYVVTPGKPSAFGGGVLLIIGGVALALGGGFLIGWGWRGTRRPL